MESDSRSPLHARQDEPEEQCSFRRAVAFFKTFGSNNARLLVGRTQATGYHASGTPHNEGIPKSHAYIGYLCNVLRAFGEEWIRRLAPGTKVPQVLPEQYFCSLFDLGIRSLRNHFRGATSSSFQDIFALIHVAIASSYIVCEDSHGCPWYALLKEMYQWQDLLSNGIEKDVFIKTMSRLCRSHEFATSSSFKEVTIDHSFLPAEQAMLVRLINHLSGNRVDMDIEENSEEGRDHSIVENEQSRLPRLLQSNTVTKQCMGFLDSKDYVYVMLGLKN